MIITLAATAVALLVTAALSFSRFARSDRWRATVTPLASIIGSGFLICGPILAREFGLAALGAMALLLLLAYAIGAVIRFNIRYAEDYLDAAATHDPVSWLARTAQGVLAAAYAISIAYYLKLLAEFSLKPLGISGTAHTLVSNAAVTAIILALVALAFVGSLKKVEHLAHGTVSLKIGIIGGLLAGLAVWWSLHGNSGPAVPARIAPQSLALLLGLVITVQGFETSRYLGHSYSKELRIQTMREAQWISSAIYLAFLALLTPFLGQAARAEGVAGILDIMTFVAPALGIFVLAGAVASQLSAAVADSIGAGGLINEVSRRRLSVPAAFGVAGALAITVTWATDPFQVVALSSRAFALFYALQCALALAVAQKSGTGSVAQKIGIVLVGAICLIATAVGAPAEG